MISERQLFLHHLAPTSDTPMLLEIERAEGVYLYDKNNRQYIDLISGISVSNVGHRHPKVLAAIYEQLEKYLHLMVYGEYVQSPQVQLAKLLTGLLPATLNCVYFVNSGSEAVEGALKLAKRYAGKSHIVSFKNAYHGSTQGALSVMGNEGFKQSFRPLLPGIHFIEFNNVKDLDYITTDTACVIVEPVQAEAGVIVPVGTYLKKLRKKCSETGALLIFDEIQTGFGRTGKLFAFERFGVVPDIITLAKGLGGGMPLGAFVASRQIMHTLKTNPALGHITTFGGHPVSCAAALASLKLILDEKLIAGVKCKEALFTQLLKHKAIKEIRSCGLLIAIEMHNAGQVKEVISRAIKNGVIIDWFLFADNCIRIAPPLTITMNEIEKAGKIILQAIDSVKK